MMKHIESRPEEYLLACRARLGDQEALSLLAERLRVPLFGLAYAELRQYEDAQDIVAATLLQVCLHIHDLREPERMRSWIWEVARNEVRRLAGKRRGRRQTETPLEGAAEASHVFVAEGERYLVLRLDIQRALEKLPAAQAEAAALHYLLGHSVHEIAARFARPPGTVKSWLHSARQKLAREMKAYEPTMNNKISNHRSTSPPALPRAVLVQTDLDASVLTRITEAFSVGGFQMDDFTMQAINHTVAGAGDTATGSWLTVALLILDEIVAGRPALEYLVYWKAQQETRNIPICVLMNDAPSSLTAAAYFSAGAFQLIAKTPSETFVSLANPQEKENKISSWVHFTEAARSVVGKAQEEARRLKKNTVSPEHLLLGITSVPESVGGRILTEKFGLTLPSIRRAVEERTATGADESWVERVEMELSPRSKRVIDLGYEEARALDNHYIGGEHLLLGLLSEAESDAAQVLNSLGVELEAAREVVRRWQQNAG